MLAKTGTHFDQFILFSATLSCLPFFACYYLSCPMFPFKYRLFLLVVYGCKRSKLKVNLLLDLIKLLI